MNISIHKCFCLLFALVLFVIQGNAVDTNDLILSEEALVAARSSPMMHQVAAESTPCPRIPSLEANLKEGLNADAAIKAALDELEADLEKYWKILNETTGLSCLKAAFFFNSPNESNDKKNIRHFSVGSCYNPTRQWFSPDENTVFSVGSVSKYMVALSVLKALDDNHITSLEDIAPGLAPIDAFGANNRFDPKLTYRRASLTWRDLLRHESGLLREVPICTRAADNVDCQTSTDAVLAYLRDTYLDFAPGSRTSYSNLGYSLAGRLIARVSANTDDWETFVMKHVYAPLDMNRTFVKFEKQPKDVQDALAYGFDAPGHTVKWMPKNFFNGWNSPCGGVYSTNKDLMSVVRLVLNAWAGRDQPLFKRRKTHDVFLSTFDLKMSRDGKTGWGDPWEVDVFETESGVFRSFSKGGNVPGYAAGISVMPELQSGFVIQGGGGFDEFKIFKHIWSKLAPLLNASLVADDVEAQRGHPTFPSDWRKSLIGSYSNLLEISEGPNESLVLKAGTTNPRVLQGLTFALRFANVVNSTLNAQLVSPGLLSCQMQDFLSFEGTWVTFGLDVGAHKVKYVQLPGPLASTVEVPKTT